MQMFRMKTGRLLSTCASLLEHCDFYPVKPPTLNCTVLMAVLAREKQRHCRQRSTDNIFALDLVNLQTLTFGSCSCERTHTQPSLLVGCNIWNQGDSRFGIASDWPRDNLIWRHFAEILSRKVIRRWSPLLNPICNLLRRATSIARLYVKIFTDTDLLHYKSFYPVV